MCVIGAVCMGHKHQKEAPIAAQYTITEPVWSTIRAIVVFGVAKTHSAESWQLIEYIPIPDPVSARDELLTLLHNAKYDKEYYVHSLYYHLSTDPDEDIDTHNYVRRCINEQKLFPSQSFKSVCESYFEARRLIETKRFCMF